MKENWILVVWCAFIHTSELNCISSFLLFHGVPHMYIAIRLYTKARSYAKCVVLYTLEIGTSKCFAFTHCNKTYAPPGQRSLSSACWIWIKIHLESVRTRAKGGVKCKLVSPWSPCQFIPPVCQHCHPSETWRQWWSCLSFGSCGLLSGANQFLCMQCRCPSLPWSRPVFILSR